MRAGQLQDYSLTLEHRFRGDWLASIAGAGDIARHIISGWNINQPLPDPPYDFNPVINAGTSFTYLHGPLLGYGSITHQTPGESAYWNVMEINVRHPVGHNLFLSAAYTWQHALSEEKGQTFFNANGGPQSVYNPHADYGNSNINVPQMLSFSWIWNLPWFQNGHGLEKQGLGGWRYSTVATIQSGFSQELGISTPHVGLATRPNFTGATTVGPKTITEWFNTAAYAAPAVGYFGNATPGSLAGPGIANFDMCVYKDFSITERHKLEFRAEAFNTFNRANWDGVSTTVGAGTFGQITSAYNPRIFEFALRYQF